MRIVWDALHTIHFTPSAAVGGVFFWMNEWVVFVCFHMNGSLQKKKKTKQHQLMAFAYGAAVSREGIRFKKRFVHYKEQILFFKR